MQQQKTTFFPWRFKEGAKEAMALGPALMVAKSGPTPKENETEIVRNKGPTDVFGPGPGFENRCCLSHN